jgi:5-methylcytosine-specific restriction endonuclease McrA
MPRKKKPLPPPVPVDFPCLNCDRPITLTKDVKLFCDEACADEAKLVRYVRRCRRDGRINQPDVREAIQIRIAHALAGGYNAKERRLSPKKRKAVIERAGGLCEKCGQPGTDIDHISGSSDDMENLQLLCRTCHNEKTKESFVPLTPEHERYEEIKAKADGLRLRTDAPTPQRICDDEESWLTLHRQIMAERRRVLHEERIKQAPPIKGSTGPEGALGVEEDSISQDLDELGRLRARREALEQEKQTRIDQVLTPELLAQVEGIEAEFEDRAESVDGDIRVLEARIRESVIRYGSTVSGTHYRAVWSKGRVGWDLKSMEQYAETHPEILVFRKEGKPSVSIRKVQQRADESLDE